MNIHAKAIAAGIGEPSNYELNTELYNRLVNGDDAAERELIERNMALVIALVDKFIAAMPHLAFLRDDLMGEGFLSLTQTVRRMKERPIERPTRYMALAVSTAIGRVIAEETQLQAPARTQHRKRQQGTPIEVPAQIAIEPEHLDSAQDPMGMTDLRDLIASCCDSDEERVIVDMREKGYTDHEIAATLNLTHSTTYLMRRNLYKRLLKKSGMEGEV